MQKQVITYHLEQFRPVNATGSIDCPAPLRVAKIVQPSPELNRFFYSAVGGDWFWIDRLSWSRSQWLENIERPELETWLLYVNDTPAGYCEHELQHQNHPHGDRVELVYFGLLPSFTGQGWGGLFMQAMIGRAWQREAQSVWLHTCSLDHPAALTFYRRQGFQDFKQETEQKELPDIAPGYWP
jgi:ribosomal protein S18 acetylase RimI-like enzyme